MKKREAAANVTAWRQQQKETSLKDDIKGVDQLRKMLQERIDYFDDLANWVNKDRVIGASIRRQKAAEIKRNAATAKLPSQFDDVLRKYEQQYNIQDDQDDQMSF